MERRLAAILSADAVGYSRMMADDELSTARTMSARREQISALVVRHGGRVVDAPGDNLLAEFPAATRAAECAVEIQQASRPRKPVCPKNGACAFASVFTWARSWWKASASTATVSTWLEDRRNKRGFQADVEY
jgi:hypothetical protein